MITENYVSFEVAKLLKEKGFEEETYGNYYLGGKFDGKFEESSKVNWNKFFKTPIAAPTQQMAMKWLRLTHKIYIQALAPVYDMDCAELGVTYNVVITNLANQCLAFDTPLEDIEYDSPEEAHEAALKYCLKNLI